MSLGLVSYASSDEDEGDGTSEAVSSNTFDISNSMLNHHKKSVINDKPTSLEAKSSPALFEETSDLALPNTSNSGYTQSNFTALPNPKKNDGLISSSKWLDEHEEALEDIVKPKGKHLVDLPVPPKKKSVPARISIPSKPSKSKDVKDSIKPVRSTKNSGLMSLLPSPVHSATKEFNRSLKPHSIKQSNKKNETKVQYKAPLPGSSLPCEHENDEEDEGSDLGNYFSLNENIVNEPVIEINPDTLPDSTNLHDKKQDMLHTMPEPHSRLLYEDNTKTNPNMSHVDSEASSSSQTFYEKNLQEDSNYIPNDPKLLMNDKAFQQLIGGKKRKKEQISFIDVHQDSQMNQIDLTKQISQETNAGNFSNRDEAMPSSMSKRKHQITYLAFQAKQRELDLKNQWADNRMSRRQTQAKYGF